MKPISFARARTIENMAQKIYERIGKYIEIDLLSDNILDKNEKQEYINDIVRKIRLMHE